jgi:hypothetical protein
MPDVKIPKWIVIYLAFASIVGLLIGITQYVHPAAMFGNLQIDLEKVKIMTLTLAGRNIAMALVAAFAIFQKNAKYLLLAYIMRFLVELQDLPAFAQTMVSGTGPVIGLTVMWLVVFLGPELFAISKLWKRARES